MVEPKFLKCFADASYQYLNFSSGVYVFSALQGVGKKVQALCPLEAEFARPPWVFGISSFAFFGNSGTQIVCTYRFVFRLVLVA